jgi:alkylated DNA repair protein (DNA oxidative demethylase)
MKVSQLSLRLAETPSSARRPSPADAAPPPSPEQLAPGAVLLHGFALDAVPTLLTELEAVLAAAPLRRMRTPGGLLMSVAMSGCGPLGWISDRAGYRYSPVDPETGRPWPALPPSLLRLAKDAAAAAGFPDFSPDACLINRYAPGCKMGLHQDRDEKDFAAPIVSVSLGLSAVFLLGGLGRSDRPSRHVLAHGDIVVFGGPSRLRYHGIAPIRAADFAPHPQLAGIRINLTLRRAG